MTMATSSHPARRQRSRVVDLVAVVEDRHLPLLVEGHVPDGEELTEVELGLLHRFHVDLARAVMGVEGGDLMGLVVDAEITRDRAWAPPR